MSTEYTKYIYAAFTQEGNIICALGLNKAGKLNLVVYDIQNFKKFQNDNYPPKFSLEIPSGANKKIGRAHV